MIGTQPPLPALPLSSPATRFCVPAGLAAGEHGFFTVVPAVAVHVEPVGAKQSRWNADGELLASNHITGGCCAAVPCLLQGRLRAVEMER